MTPACLAIFVLWLVGYARWLCLLSKPGPCQNAMIKNNPASVRPNKGRKSTSTSGAPRLPRRPAPKLHSLCREHDWHSHQHIGRTRSIGGSTTSGGIQKLHGHCRLNTISEVELRKHAALCTRPFCQTSWNIARFRGHQPPRGAEHEREALEASDFHPTV